MRRLLRVSSSTVDRTPHPQRRSRVRTTALAIIALVLCGACGEERAQPPPAKRSLLPDVRGADALRDGFSLQTGEACSRFVAEVAPLQIKLRRLQGEVGRDRQARERAKRVVKKIQSRSRGFLLRLNEAPLPSSPRRRQDASRLRASTEEFIGLQRDSLDLVSGLLDDPRRVSRAEKARVSKLGARLGAKLREQQTLVRGLDIPECLPS